METIFKKNSINELNAHELEQIASFCSDEATFLLLKETFNHIEKTTLKPLLMHFYQL